MKDMLYYIKYDFFIHKYNNQYHISSKKNIKNLKKDDKTMLENH